LPRWTRPYPWHNLQVTALIGIQEYHRLQ
jgi:hypothetical protein